MTETNFDKALHVCMSLDMDDGDVPSPLDYVRALREAGLLAPDLPEPWIKEGEDGAFDTEWAPNYTVACSDISTGAWSEVERTTGKVWLDTGGAIGMDVNHGDFYMDAEDAKKIALALLAAADYAEKERPCSTS